jgi:hypothetical protein
MDVEALLAELDAWADDHDRGFATCSYGDHPDQIADVRRGGPRVAILLHGGFWRPAFTRANTRALAVDLALRGWTTWNVEYRRTGVADTLADVDAALDLTGRGVAIGDAAVALAPVTDLARAAQEGIGAGAVVEFAGTDPSAHADPMRRLPLRVPVLLVHGDGDDRVPVDYSRSFAAASGCDYLELAGTGHFELIDPRSREWGRVVDLL